MPPVNSSSPQTSDYPSDDDAPNEIKLNHQEAQNLPEDPMLAPLPSESTSNDSTDSNIQLIQPQTEETDATSPGQPQPLETAGSSSLENIETEVIKDIPQDGVASINPHDTKEAPHQDPDPSPERVSLTDLSSYRPKTDFGQDDIASGPPSEQESKENIYTDICRQIIKEQEQIIGTLAVEQAQQVVGLTVDPATFQCTVIGDGSKVIDDLIEQYRDFFGHAAVEVCKEAAYKFVNKLPFDARPTLLR